MFDYAFLILLPTFLERNRFRIGRYEDAKPVAGIIGTCIVGALFALSLYTAYQYFFYTGEYMLWARPSM